MLFLWVAIKRKREKYFQKGKSNNNKKNEGKERKERKKERAAGAGGHTLGNELALANDLAQLQR